MFRHEMSTFLLAVLDAVERRDGLQVDHRDEPDPAVVAAVAEELNTSSDDIRLALEGLRAAHCLVEDVLEIPGAEPVVWWRVHPQCLQPAGGGDAEDDYPGDGGLEAS